MNALAGDLGQRARGALAAGCDLALHCNGEMAEMRAIDEAVGPLSESARARLTRAAAALPRRLPLDRGAALARLDGLMAAA
jgi:beta-N-acetylhexosaminidase